MKKILLFGAILVSLALLTVGLTACKSREKAEAAAADETEERVVGVFGAFRPPEDARFEESIKPFEEESGVDVQYEFSPEFETQIFVRVEGGDPPDIAALPQPGLMKDFADRDVLVPLWDGIKDMISDNYASVWLDLGSYEGEAYGVFHRVNIKSLVWYPKKDWAEAGYEPPETWDELEALMDEMVANGHTPWTIGIESGAATGWPATDWLEDIMLRTAGPDVYDQWVAHEIPFDAPEVKRALGIIGDIWKNPDYVYGGTQYILTSHFGNDAPGVMFEDPPKAWMHRQGSFIAGFLPDEVQNNLDEEVGVFGLPSIDPEWGTPVLGGGDQFVMFNDRPAVRSFMEFLTTGESGEAWARAGGALFPHKDQNLDAYPTEIARAQAELLLNAEVFRFDASDLMPAEVGAGTFWTGMVDWVSGTDADRVLETIDESWPE